MVEKRTVQSVSAAQARRIALAAQGFGRPQPASIGIRQLDAALHRLQVLQLDSVNVFERSHYLPLFARLGGYDKAQLDRLTFGRKARYTEYWAHVAALIPLEDWPLWRWKMAGHKAKWEADPNSWVSTHATFLNWLRAELREKGPLSASQVEHETAGKRRGGWWEWSDVKIGLEYLFYMGDAVAAGRTRFERTYGVPEDVIPAELREIDIDEATAYRTLLLKAAQAHGIGTVGDLADYFRLYKIPAAKILRDLAAEGELVQVAVEGWKSGTRPLPAYLHPSARIPRRVEAAALLSPFDPVVWERDRALRMFGFHYRIEIYTPAPKRLYGYYTLPVLVDDRIVARIDLKSDRQAGVLRVQSAWHEEGQPRGYETRIAQLLRDTAAWQGLGDLEVRNWGDLAPAMAAELDVALLTRATDAETAQPEEVLAGD